MCAEQPALMDERRNMRGGGGGRNDVSILRPMNRSFFYFFLIHATQNIVYKIIVFLFAPLQFSCQKILCRKNIGKVFAPSPCTPQVKPTNGGVSTYDRL